MQSRRRSNQPPRQLPVEWKRTSASAPAARAQQRPGGGARTRGRALGRLPAPSRGGSPAPPSARPRPSARTRPRPRPRALAPGAGSVRVPGGESGASRRRRERSPRGRLRGLSGRRRLSRRRCSSRLSRGGRVGGGCGRRRATRRPLSSGREASQVGSPPRLEERGGLRGGGARGPGAATLGPGRALRPAARAGAGGAERRAGLRALLMQPEPRSRGGGSALGAEGGEGGRSWQRAGEVGRQALAEGREFVPDHLSVSPEAPSRRTCPPRSPLMGRHCVPRRGRMQLTNAYC